LLNDSAKKSAHKKRACFKKTGHKDNNSDG
jgi:hypothetical protein